MPEITINLNDDLHYDPVTYQYFNQLFNHRTVVFNDEIDNSIVESIYIPLRDFENDDSDEPVTLILNSEGGSVTDGFFLAHYLTTYKKRLNVIVTGYAASMATVLLAAGGKNNNIHRICYPSTFALIHDGYVGLPTGESKTVEDIMNFNHRLDLDIRQFIIDNTNITAEQYDAKTRHQWYLHADEMKELNLVDEIIGCEE